MRKRKVSKKIKNLWIIFPIIVLLVLVINSSNFLNQNNTEKILFRLSEFPEVQPYVNNPVKVTYMSIEEILELAKDKPVIYGNITKDVYQVEYFSNGSGLLVLYDFKENKIIRYFYISSINWKK